ncbi:DUF6786 family protein [uncultured Algibacter sp.]|uniref:DUF6786 family protein n=1 Tax=uncultured Algibacter sp. TaxID=298659 RepID=UPI002634701F|nr:DUF6786 family protein [uncultured Algibacter sp.]
MKKYSLFLIALFLGFQVSCQEYPEGTFGNDLKFLKQKTNPIVLEDGVRQIIISPEYQGRILTATSKGKSGSSYGWFRKALILSDSVNQNKSGLGGAGRLWFGPDQGPNTLFFKINPKTGKKEHGAPKDLNELEFKVLKRNESLVSLGEKLHLKNLKNTEFYIDVKRDIKLLKRSLIEKKLGITLNDNLSYVAFKAETSMQNIGEENWSKEKGLICLWELGCMHPSEKTTVVIPLKGKVDEATVYFTPLDSTRIDIKENILYYRADANYLNKIGTLPENSLEYFGSYSPELNLLTIVRYSFNANTMDYVNAHPVSVKDQYRGDVINVFNDGKLGDIGPFGPFYELETSSPAVALKMGESLSHSHETYYFEGSKEDLNPIAVRVLGVNLDVIEKALP